MALASYDELIAAIPDFLNRQDLTGVIPSFIALAEAQINRRLRVRRMVGRASASISAEFAALPTDFIGPIDAVLSTGAVLDCLSIDALLQRKRESGLAASGGAPLAYAVVGSQFQFWPAPGAATEIDLTYFARLAPLSVSNPTNWLMSEHPDAYLYGALLQSAPYLQDDARLNVWGELFTTILDDIQTANDRETYGARLAPHTSQYA